MEFYCSLSFHLSIALTLKNLSACIKMIIILDLMSQMMDDSILMSGVEFFCSLSIHPSISRTEVNAHK